jgi:hypothetical protein
MYNQRKVPMPEQLAERGEHQITVHSLWLDIKHTIHVQGVTVNSAASSKLGKQCLLVCHVSKLSF